MPQQKSILTALHNVSQTGALVIVAMGAAVLAGWILDVTLLKSVWPALASMKVNTALGLAAAGISLWCAQRPSSPTRAISQGLAILIVLLGALTLAQDVLAINLGIDQFLLRDTRLSGPVHPGRMSPASAVCLFFSGAALIALTERQSRQYIAWTYWLTLPAVLISSVALVGYAYDVTSLYTIGAYASMAVHTAGAFFALSMCIFAADPSRGIARIMASDSAGGVVARRLPAIPLVVFGLGWLRIKGQDAGLYDTHFGVALMVVLTSALSVAVVVSTALTLHAVDTSRERAVADLVLLNAGLDQRVRDRTQELEASFAQVKQLRGLLPICAWCNKIRDDEQRWQSVAEYVSARTDAEFTHGICPACEARETASI